MSKKSSSPTYMFVFREPAKAPDFSPEQMQSYFGLWMSWVAVMKKKGQYLAGDPLEVTPAKVLRGPRGAKITDGPFAEAKEIVGGYMLITAKTMAAAAKIAKDCPGYTVGGSVEVRQVMPM